ncbi:MAG: PA14 domain-containing protein, partial [Phycisphaeraceae bacterium]
MTLATLEFTGDLSVWLGLALAVAFAVGTWRVYRRESRTGSRFAVLLPLLRMLAVMLIILMLTGPVLYQRSFVGEPGRVLIFVDASESMAMQDPYMDLARKILIARAHGWLGEDAFDTTLHDAAASLRDARAGIENPGFDERPDPNQIALDLRDRITKVSSRLEQLGDNALPSAGSAKIGSILREYWFDIPGDKLTDLTNHPRFVGVPSGTHSPDLFEAPPNLGDNYGTRMRGYVLPPVSGNYVFWITSDGPSELWLSTSESDADRKRIARVTTNTPRRGWTTGESQSAPIELVGGKRYYIEALHKEGIGEDHLAVGWQLPIGSQERPIPGKRLIPYAGITAGSPASRRQSMIASFKQDLLDPLEAIIVRDASTDINRLKKLGDLTSLAAVMQRWEFNLRQAFENYARSAAKAGDVNAMEAIARVDQTTRWDRLRTTLLSDQGLVRRLSESHQIEIYALRPGEARLIYSSDRPSRAPAGLDVQPNEPVTDLAAGLLQRGGGASKDSATDARAGEPVSPRTVAILLSDGQHNLDGSNPQTTAALLADRRLPVYTIGIGGLERPEDLAIRSVEAPQSVYIEDRVQGHIVIDDDMPPGKPFTVRIENRWGKVWEKQLITERTGVRQVPFDFSVKELVETNALIKGGLDGSVKQTNLPLPFKVTVSAIEGESEPANNQAGFTVQAITEPRKVLLIDGRPRWESRYLRNLFERDQRWQLNPLLAGVKLDGAPWRRGDEIGAFPRDIESLFKYDLIILGDVPGDYLTDVEQGWIRDFVGDRGGGLILIDGQRGNLKSFNKPALADLLPVQWLDEDVTASGQPQRLKLTAAGQGQSVLRLLSDPLDNASLWTELYPPRWIASVKVLPGAEALAEAVLGKDGERVTPAIVQRSYGAGRVLYMAFDETWRWRYEVADLYHVRFW